MRLGSTNYRATARKTMESVVRILHALALRAGVDWTAVQRRLRIIGLRDRTKNSPNTWRWEQHQRWLELIPDAQIKNVSASQDFIYYITGMRPKVRTSFHPGRWARPESGASERSAEQREAIALAAQLYDLGRTREERRALASRIARDDTKRPPSTRAQVLALRGSRGLPPVRVIAASRLAMALALEAAPATSSISSRNGLDWTKHLPSVAAVLAKLKAKSFTVGGEAAVLDDRGASSFARTQDAMSRVHDRKVVLFAFDLLELDVPRTRLSAPVFCESLFEASQTAGHPRTYKEI